MSEDKNSTTVVTPSDAFLVLLREDPGFAVAVAAIRTAAKAMRPAMSRPRPQVVEALADLVAWAELSICLHETTHRGGEIWEICSDCGAEWADDRGGKPADAHEYPLEVRRARAVIDAGRDGDLREQFCRIYDVIEEVADAMLVGDGFELVADITDDDTVLIGTYHGTTAEIPWDYIERKAAGDESWRREVSDQLDANSIQAQEDLETTERATLAALKAKYESGDE